MSLYAIGDVQGCYDALQRLLTAIAFDPEQDKLWLTGDLVNRGPQSLEVMRLILSLEHRVISVLGNHDLHLLAVYHQVAKPTREDTFQDVLTDPEVDNYIRWLQRQPLVVYDAPYQAVLVHAGILPTWTLSEALAWSDIYSTALQTDPVNTLRSSYGNTPAIWSEQLSPEERLRFICNVFTRMRMIDKNTMALALAYKGDVAHAPPDLTPWFLCPNLSLASMRTVFGHWAALNGDHLGQTHYIPLDTGCVWGNKLTAYRLDDGATWQVNAR